MERRPKRSTADMFAVYPFICAMPRPASWKRWGTGEGTNMPMTSRQESLTWNVCLKIFEERVSTARGRRDTKERWDAGWKSGQSGGRQPLRSLLDVPGRVLIFAGRAHREDLALLDRNFGHGAGVLANQALVSSRN